MLLYIVWGVQKTQNLTKEYTYRVRTLIWPFYFNLDHCALHGGVILFTINSSAYKNGKSNIDLGIFEGFGIIVKRIISTECNGTPCS